jgi:ribosomal protein L11 methyltransferase
MQTSYIQLEISLPADLHEIIIAELSDMDFEGFDQQGDVLLAWIPSPGFDDVKRERIEEILIRIGGGANIISVKEEEPRNWNSIWEESIQPMQVGRFYITPTWGKKEETGRLITLLIDPKMAFGTGYHETTRIILRLLPDFINGQESVLDAGTGTGILAIASIKLGAKQAFGFDIDEWSFQNATENILLNEVADNVTIKLGSEETIPHGQHFEVVIANINRNILIEMAPVLCNAVENNGMLLLSGLLHSDEQSILNNEHFALLKHVKTERENDWIGMAFRKF